MDASTRTTLTGLGVRNSHDVIALAEAGNVQARSLLPQAGPVPFASVSAFDALKSEGKRGVISTGSCAINKLFRGGFPTAQVTELCGPPGVGKTQFGMQMCVNVQLLVGKGGVGGEAIYIDTEGSFSVDRVAEMAAASVDSQTPNLEDDEKEARLNDILTKIQVFRVHDHIEQTALLNQLEDVIKSNPKIKLIVLDSIAFHFRQGFADMGLRSRLLSSSAQILRKLAGTYGICVLVVNQMTTKMVKMGNQDVSTLVPALGDSWGHACTNRVVLFWRNGNRQAMLVKSPNFQEDVANYDISTSGICDLQE